MAKKKDPEAIKVDNKSALLKLIKKYKEKEPTEWLRSGIHALDLILGGGFPIGRITEIYGQEQSCKSTLGWLLAKVIQGMNGAVIFIDIEATEPVEHMKTLGIDGDFIFRPNKQLETVEQVRDFINETVGEIRAIDPSIPILVLWDSIAATSCNGEWEEFESRKLRERDMPGVRAAAISSYLRKHTGWLKTNKVTMICINQLRDKIGVMYGRKDDSPGGKALKYGASVRLELHRGQQMKNGDDSIGFELRARVEKNKFAPCFRKATLQFKFGHGIDPYEGLPDVLESAGRIKKIKGGIIKAGEFEFESAKAAVEQFPELLDNWI